MLLSHNVRGSFCPQDSQHLSIPQSSHELGVQHWAMHTLNSKALDESQNDTLLRSANSLHVLPAAWGRAAKNRGALLTSQCSGAQLLHSTTGLCCQHGRGGEERDRTGTYHISASPEGLLIPAYELEEKQSFIFTLFSCLQIKVKAPVL